jgi:hypothetical protein
MPLSAKGWEGVQKIIEPEDLPVAFINFNAFG